MKSFSNKSLNFFLQKVLFLLHFGSCQNCMSSANLVAENHEKLCNRRVLSTGEPCTCEYVTLLQSFDRVTLSIHWYIAQKFSCPSFFKRLFRIAIFSRFSKVAIATSNLMNEFYNGGFSPEFSVSVFKEIIALVGDYVSEIRSKTSDLIFHDMIRRAHTVLARSKM